MRPILHATEAQSATDRTICRNRRNKGFGSRLSSNTCIINDKCKNKFLKHKRDNRQNNFIESQLQRRPNQNKLSWYDVMDDDDLQKLLKNSCI